jgi:hypothetical protein
MIDRRVIVARASACRTASLASPVTRPGTKAEGQALRARQHTARLGPQPCPHRWGVHRSVERLDGDLGAGHGAHPLLRTIVNSVCSIPVNSSTSPSMRHVPGRDQMTSDPGADGSAVPGGGPSGRPCPVPGADTR